MGPLSVVIPTLDEAERLPRLLEDLRALDDVIGEVIVVDGGSRDGTVSVARQRGATVVESDPGRGRQLRAGSRAARGPWLFFVHADCRLPPDSADRLRAFLRTASSDDFAHFRFELEGTGPFVHFIEFGQRLRERLYGLVYGDQGLVVSRALYEQVDGHPEWPLMEDVGVIDRLEEAGRRVALAAALPTSARRYAREGGLRAWLRNAVLIARFRLGASPDLLARSYRPERAARRSTLVVFAKAPVPGRVKTRLAADLGDDEAVRIYRAIGSETVRAVRAGAWRTSIWISTDEPADLLAVSEWLDVDRTDLRSQRGADLGARMYDAIRTELTRADQVVVIGTDIPGIGPETIEGALKALEESEIVIGPATDGGYYLIGMRRPHPELFRNISWSTDTVLERTLAAAGQSKLSVTLLEAKTDVDTLSDVPASYRAG